LGILIASTPIYHTKMQRTGPTGATRAQKTHPPKRLAPKSTTKPLTPSKTDSPTGSQKTNSSAGSQKTNNPTESTKPVFVPCAAVRSPSSTHLQCMFGAAKGHKYCPLHSSYKTVMDYDSSEREVAVEKEIIDPKPNPLFFSETIKSLVKKEVNTPTANVDMKKAKKKAVHKEDKKEAIQEAHEKNEEILEVKFLIMMNEGNMRKEIERLVGPAFNDITLSEDEQDPLTLDRFWEMRDGRRVPLVENKYYLFSYIDSKQKLRCLTIFTLHSMFAEKDYCHPLTMEPIGDEDIQRGADLIEIYSTRLGLFNNESLIEVSPEYELKSKVDRFFKAFHVHSIYFESGWLMNIETQGNLEVVIRNTTNIINNNSGSISSRPINLPTVPFVRGSSKKGKAPKYEKPVGDIVFEYKKYIFSMWEEIITKANDINNQVPIWIIACGMANTVPAIREKFPHIDQMLQ